MSKKLFTEQEIIILKQNKYIKKVSSKGITYTDEFKKIFINIVKQWQKCPCPRIKTVLRFVFRVVFLDISQKQYEMVRF